MKSLFFLLISFVAFLSCKNVVDKSNIESAGFDFDLSSVYLTSPILLDSVQFADGSCIYSLHGTLSIEGKLKPFSVQTFGNPISQEITVNNTKPPVEFNSKVRSDFLPNPNFVLFVENKVAEMSWRLGPKWLFVRASITGAN